MFERKFITPVPVDLESSNLVGVRGQVRNTYGGRRGRTPSTGGGVCAENRSCSSRGPRASKFSKITQDRLDTLIMGSRIELRPQWAGFGQKFIAPVPVDLGSSNLA